MFYATLITMSRNYFFRIENFLSQNILKVVARCTTEPRRADNNASR